MRILSTAVIAVALIGGYAATAATPTAASAVAARKANFKEIGGAFKSINDELKASSPDFNSIRPAARDLASRAAASLKYFPKGSGPESGEKTRAKPAIWTQGAQFAKLQGQLVQQANALNAAAISGNLAAVATARNALGGTCKSCHETFRESE